MIDAFNQPSNFNRDIVRQSAMLMVQFFERKKQLVIKLVRSRSHELMDQIAKMIRLHHEMGISKAFSERVDHFREIFRPG